MLADRSTLPVLLTHFAASAAYRAWGHRKIGEAQAWGEGRDRYCVSALFVPFPITMLPVVKPTALVLGNFTGDPAPVRLPADWECADLVITNLQDAPLLHPALTLEPWEAHVHRRDG
ncbi:hypothetical protein AB0K02_23165 [Streptomyces sp. NPDC049597]|uniref:hypothetical protein n=1 Tax=Streptomyces sp. NPDC049597 TaxID=3155276 RepID=UPI003437237F